MVVKGNYGQGSESKKESCRESFYGLRENSIMNEQSAGRNTNVKGAFG